MFPIKGQADDQKAAKQVEDYKDLLKTQKDAFPIHTNPQQEFETKFSGTKEEFPTGATRDNQVGKGRYDLIPPQMLKRLAGVYERGALNHGDSNWTKGIPLSRLFNSAQRHLEQARLGMTDEDHLAQAIRNITAIIYFEETGRKELDDVIWRSNG